MVNHLIVALLLIPASCFGSKVVMLPFPYISHIREFVAIGNEMVNRGHEVSLVLPSHYKDIDRFRSNDKIPILEYTAKYEDFLMTFGQAEMDDYFDFAVKTSPMEDIHQFVDGVAEMCYNILENEDLNRKVQDTNFNVAIIDGMVASRCYYILAYRLDIPYVSLTTNFEAWLWRNPVLPSFFPNPFRLPVFSPEMTFWERFLNTKDTISYYWFLDQIPYLSNDMVAKYAPNKPYVTINQLAAKSLLWLLDTDLSIDFPRPVMPNEVHVGGMCVGPAKPLENQVLEFVESAPKGVILVSFGSTNVIPKKFTPILLAAFKKLPSWYHIIWRYTYDDELDLPDNIMLMKWVPQNDVLAHPKTKLFVTHLGANGQFEALYHGVPTFGFPVFGDQPYNAKRMEYLGFGRAIRPDLMTVDIVYDNINTILNDPSYSKKIQKASAIYRSRSETPAERAASSIEHVITFGGDHLHSHALDMPWYEYIMLDILAASCAVILIMFCMVYHTCKFMVSSFRKRFVQMKEKEM